AAVFPFIDWSDSGSSVSYAYSDPVASTVAGKRYAVTTPASSPASPITVSGAATITGTYKVQFQLTFAQSGIGGDSTGTVVTINGSVTKTAAVLPFSDWFDSGASVTYTYSSPVPTTVAGKRYTLTTPAPSPGGPISVSGAATITGSYKVQFLLTITTNPPVVARTNVTPPDGWFDTGSVISLSAASPVAGGPGVGYVFKNWTGDVSASPNATNPLGVAMNQARTVVANYFTWQLDWTSDSAFAAQYSDVTRLKVVLMSDGVPVSGKTITFSVGTDSGSALTSASGVATDTTTLTQNPAPPYIATATCPVVQCGVTLTITH